MTFRLFLVALAALLSPAVGAQPLLAQSAAVAGGTTADASGGLLLGSSAGLVAPGRFTSGGVTLEGGFWYGVGAAAAECPPAGGPLPVTSAFDTDAECWTAAAESGSLEEFGWFDDGNDEFVRALVETGPALVYFEAPPAYLGADAAALYGGTLAFDLRVFVGVSSSATESPDVVLVGPGGERYRRAAGVAPDGDVFTSYSVPLTEAGWADASGNAPSEADFRALLGSFTALRIYTSRTAITSIQTADLDNVVLSGGTTTPGGTPPLYAEVPATVNVGDTFEATVYAGTTADPVADLFGVSFGLDLANATVDGTQRLSYVSARAPETDCDGDGQPDPTIFQAFPSGTPTGEVALAFSLRGDECATGLDGRVPVAIVTLTADAAGDQALDLSDPTANDSAGDAITLDPVDRTFAITTGLVVWPGDTDDSGLVDAQDLLPIGARFGETGPARDPAERGIRWEPKQAPVWPTPSDTYVDANGDGTIDAADVLAVGLNFGETQPAPAAPALATAPPEEAERATVAQVRAHATADALAEVVIAPQPVGTEVVVTVGVQADGVLGAAALLALPAGLEAIDAAASPRLDNGDLLTFWSATADGGVDVAATRKRGADLVSGTGDLLAVTLRVEAEMTGPVVVALARLTLGTADGSQPAPADAVSLASPFAVAGEDGPAAAFGLASVAPNPSRDQATVRLGMDVAADAARVAVYDALGREVAVLWDGPLAAGEHALALASSGLAPGVYLVRLATADRADVRQLTVVR